MPRTCWEAYRGDFGRLQPTRAESGDQRPWASSFMPGEKTVLAQSPVSCGPRSALPWTSCLRSCPTRRPPPQFGRGSMGWTAVTETAGLRGPPEGKLPLAISAFAQHELLLVQPQYHKDPRRRWARASRRPVKYAWFKERFPRPVVAIDRERSSKRALRRGRARSLRLRRQQQWYRRRSWGDYEPREAKKLLAKVGPEATATLPGGHGRQHDQFTMKTNSDNDPRGFLQPTGRPPGSDEIRPAGWFNTRSPTCENLVRDSCSAATGCPDRGWGRTCGARRLPTTGTPTAQAGTPEAESTADGHQRGTTDHSAPDHAADAEM
jgi:hypothetical protein